EGFRPIHVLPSPEQVAAVTIERTRPWTDRRDDHGPFDIIGDIHGCRDELVVLLAKLGYAERRGVGSWGLGVGDDARRAEPEGLQADLGSSVNSGRSNDVSSPTPSSEPSSPTPN